MLIRWFHRRNSTVRIFEPFFLLTSRGAMVNESRQADANYMKSQLPLGRSKYSFELLGRTSHPR